MKTNVRLSCAAAAMAVAFTLPAVAADAPAAAGSAAAKASASAKADAPKKKRVAPHNHMRDSKGIWVADKKAGKDGKKEGDDASKAPAGRDQK